MEEPRSYHHLVMYWGFLVLTVASTEMLIGGLLGEWFTLGTLLGDFALRLRPPRRRRDERGRVRRADVRLLSSPRSPSRSFVPANLDAMLILGAITTLVRDPLRPPHLAHGRLRRGRPDDAGRPDHGRGSVACSPSRARSSRSSDGTQWAHVAAEVHWWGHVAILLGFLNYLPFSKHIHVLGSGPNILLRNQGQRGAMPKLASCSTARTRTAKF